MTERINLLTKRIDEFIKQKEMSIRAFEQSIGASDGLLRRAIKQNTDICSTWICAMAKTYPELNIEWLLRGTEPMIRNPYQSPSSSANSAMYRDLCKLDRKLNLQLNQLKLLYPELYSNLNQTS